MYSKILILKDIEKYSRNAQAKVALKEGIKLAKEMVFGLVKDEVMRFSFLFFFFSMF